MAQSMASPSTVSSATLPLQLSGGEVFSRCGGRGFAAPSPTLKHHGHVVAVANSTASAARGGNWVINQCSQFQQQMGFLASKSTTPINCKRVAGVASISDIFSFVSGGGNKGFGGWGFGGGGGGGGDGSAVPAAGETLFATSDDEALILITEDVIYLQGMSCGGCSGKVKRILEAQPQVKEATVDLAAKTAAVQVITDPVDSNEWESIKRQLGESLAEHLTSCGFNSSLREQEGATIASTA
ncbi:uncharacterized protein [Physcomitrium patens]|uniref:HMA domain-containing protein n=1 Tax=Physcomitrium patens TaxID=3218 RepID=A0A7I4BDE1_PHYPA|nr:copper-transporting ATPase PAA1, chloroplastic-like isoform X2 [Physcomitrium patens]|eukprot:XP_024402670.1 copper-transporting ATPase PAA1, chloroplastic-like isoform X2 [Physcomitrella patens]